MRAEASGALPLRDQVAHQRVPWTPQVGTRSRPAPPAARRTYSSCSLLSAVPSAPTRAETRVRVDSVDESTVTSPSSGRALRYRCRVPRSPRPFRVPASGQLHMYNMSYDAVDYADALQPLQACVHVSCREDVLR